MRSGRLAVRNDVFDRHRFSRVRDNSTKRSSLNFWTTLRCASFVLFFFLFFSSLIQLSSIACLELGRNFSARVRVVVFGQNIALRAN